HRCPRWQRALHLQSVRSGHTELLQSSDCKVWWTSAVTDFVRAFPQWRERADITRHSSCSGSRIGCESRNPAGDTPVYTASAPRRTNAQPRFLVIPSYKREDRHRLTVSATHRVP